MIDRVLKTVHTELYEASLEVYRTRFWWDSASPTYFHQIGGLLAYDIPKGNLLYGTVRDSINLNISRALVSSTFSASTFGAHGNFS